MLRKIISLCVIAYSAQSFARDNIDGFIGFGYNVINQRAEVESGTRSRMNLEFARLSKNVSLDAFFGKGLGYSDIGFNFSVFNLFHIPSEDSFFKMTLGAGFTGAFQSDDPKFWDWGVMLPQARLIFDSGIGLAASINLGYEMIFKRAYTSGSETDDGSLRGRILVGLSLLTTSNWLE
jgi:hypothetical protein